MTEAAWLAATDPVAVYKVIYRRKRPSRGRNGQFLNEIGIDWNKSVFDIFAEIKGTEAENLAFLIRCFFGNPYRPVSADPKWLTSTAVALAEGIYAERAFDRMPILADALEEAGCDNHDILNHLRSDEQHVKGCWALGLVFGKS